MNPLKVGDRVYVLGITCDDEITTSIVRAEPEYEHYRLGIEDNKYAAFNEEDNALWGDRRIFKVNEANYNALRTLFPRKRIEHFSNFVESEELISFS